MPLYKSLKKDGIDILIWRFEEADLLQVEDLLNAEELVKIEDLHPTKAKEMLMVRHLLKMVLPDYKISYKENGEPFLVPEDYFISITHSFPFAAIGISKQRIGIDIEKLKDKITKIRHKFILHENNFINDDKEIEYLTSIWCVKESLYKIHHSKYWSLKKHYDVQPFEISDQFSVECRVYDEEIEDNFVANVEFFDNYCMAFVK